MLEAPALSCGKQGLNQWQERLHTVCGRFDTVLQDDPLNFFGGVAVSHLGELEVADVATNAYSLRKSAADVRAEDGRHYFLIYQHSGSSVLMQHERQAVLAEGDLALIDSRFSSEFRYLEGMRHLSFHLPCDALERRMAGRPVKVCAALRGSEPLGSVLGSFVRQVIGQRAEFAERESAAIGDALLAMLAPLHEDQELPGGNLRDYSRVVSYIDTRLQEELGPQRIARDVGVSVRSLYRLFEDRDQSLAGYIRDRRLNRCAEEMRASSHRHENLTSIAFRWGFKDSAHFSRSFRSHFGMTPRDYRRTS